MRYLLDTNILVRFSNLDDSQSPMVRAGISGLLKRGDDLFLVPQSLYEFWSVCTRPKTGNSNGVGWTPIEAREELDKLLEQFTLLPDRPELFERWLELVTKFEVSGRPSHDARLVAAMQTHGLTHLLTLNTDDFKRFSSVSALHPSSLI